MTATATIIRRIMTIITGKIFLRRLGFFLRAV